MTDIVEYVTNTKWKWAGHIARMKANRWTVRITEWQINCVRFGRPKRCWRDDIVGQQGVVWTRIAKDREWKTVAEGYFLQWKGTAWNRIVYNHDYDLLKNGTLVSDNSKYQHELITIMIN